MGSINDLEGLAPEGRNSHAKDTLMSHSHTLLYAHCIFATKDRRNYITTEIQPRLYKYITAIVADNDSALIAIGGTNNHIHLLLKIHPSKNLADIMRLVKTNSSKWIHETFQTAREFGWQSGYGAFSVNASSVNDVKGYIDRQEEHHQTQTFKQEYVAFLNRHGIEYDDRYLWS